MSDYLTKPFSDLLDRIPTVAEPEEVWVQPKRLKEDNFDYSAINMNAYKEQVLYNILHNAAWTKIKDRVNLFISRIKPLSIGDISEHQLELDMQECYNALKVYIDELAERLFKAESIITRLFALKPNNISKISEKILEPTSQIIKDINEVQGDAAFTAALAHALTDRKLMEEAKNAQKIVRSARDSMEDARRKKNLPDPVLISQSVESMQSCAQVIVNELHSEVTSLEKNLLDFFWNRQDIELLYMKKGDDQGFDAASEAFYRRLIAKAKCELIDKNVFAKGVNVDITSDSASNLLHIVSNAQMKINKLENGFFIEFALWMCVCILLGGVGCLTYYAYELHIKPLRLGIALALVGISVGGLFVRNWYQQDKIRAVLSTNKLVRQQEATMVVDPSLMQMAPLLEEPRELSSAI